MPRIRAILSLVILLGTACHACVEVADLCYVEVLSDRCSFEAYADRNNFPGAMQVPEVKFLLSDVRYPDPTLYLMNTRLNPYHYYFAVDCLGWTLSLAAFNRQTYFTDYRRHLAGSLIAHDFYEPKEGEPGIYTLEFWPTDPVSFEFVELAYDKVAEAMPFASDRIYYHPAGLTQQELYQAELDAYQSSQVQVIETSELFANVSYSPMNPGEAYGRLRIVQGSEILSVQDIAVFETLPNNLSHISGIVTAVPQTPLSHVNLKAQQNHTPNAYIKNATTDPDILAFDGHYVHYVVDANGYRLTAADFNEVMAFLDSIRPTEPQFPPRDLSLTTIEALSDLGFEDSERVGAKAANVAELARCLPDGMVPEGFAVPFYFYDQFMQINGFYQMAQDMMDQNDFKTDPEIREQRLDDFRHTIRRNSTVPAWMLTALDQMHQSFPSGTSLRCRSSTNNEDLPDFNGAGLYDSYTHHPDEGHIAKSMRQVWASLWTYRAFEEREFYRIDHLQAAMGVLVHPNYENEQANGVGVTQNIYDPNWPGYYVNVQLGEDLVTNPEPNSIPDEFLVADLLGQERYEIQYIRHSNLIEAGTTLLSKDQVFELADMMGLIQEHFAPLYNREDLAMEIEFKITAEGNLEIKQARPWIELAGPAKDIDQE